MSADVIFEISQPEIIFEIEGAVIAQTVNFDIHAAPELTSILNSDEIAIVAVATPTVLRKTLFSTIKSTLKTYFDTLYNYYTLSKSAVESVLTGVITSHSHTVTKSDVGLSNVPNLSFSGSNTGDQNLSGYVLKSVLDANSIMYAVTDDTPAALSVPVSSIIGRKATGGVVALTAAELRSLINVENGANNYSHPNHSGDVTSVGGGAQTIASKAVTNAKMADMATKTYKGRTDALTGQPQDVTVATLKTDLDLTGTNTGDETNATIKTKLGTDLSGKQDALVSGTTLKTVNSSSLLGSGDVVITATVTLDSVKTAINSADVKASIVDNDYVHISDSADSATIKRTLFSVIKSALKTYFDGIYSVLTLSTVKADTDIASAISNTHAQHSDDQTLSGLGGVAANTAITPATKTKIAYDAKGLVTSGADATTADIADSTNKRYVSDTQLSNIHASGSDAETASSIATIITGAGAFDPLDADEFSFYKIVGTILKKVTWLNIKSVLKTYFDGVYTPIANSHVATTVTTTNGLSISGQEISLGVASTNSHGALTDTDWNTFNNKQAAGSYLVAADIAGKLDKSTYNANTILIATSDDTPIALTINASRIVGRKATGDIVDLTAAEVLTILGLSATFSKSFVITNPTASSDLPLWRVPYNITITSIHVLTPVGVIVGQLYEYDTNGLNGSSVDATDITTTAATDTADDGSLTNAGIAANNYLGWKTTSVSGTPTSAIISFTYTLA